MALLGDDGRGFDLAKRLDLSGVWRTWLGDSIYSSFLHYLSSPSSWEAFMRVDESKSRAQIQLQLRVRALLFDKATVSLFLRSNSFSDVSSSVAVSKLNPNYLQLHGDDVYYTLENASPEGGIQRDGGGLRHNPGLSKSQSKPSFNSGRRGSESDFSNLAQRSRFEELPDTWYTQFISRCGFKYGMSVGGQESDKRTPEGMSTYLRVVDTHKRKRAPFLEDRSTGSSAHMSRSNLHPSSGFDGSGLEDDILLLPETMFRMNCVPETALSPIARTQDDVKTEFYGVLDTLPQVTTTRSHVMIERLRMMPEYLKMEERGGLRRKKAEKMGFSDEQAAQVSRKVVARMLLTMGFEGATEVPVDVFSQLLSRHICKLGGILKVLTDSYKKECSAVQLMKMFLNTTGYSNLGSLAELVKDGTRIHHPPNQKQPQVLQQQLHMQQQAPQRLPQQIQRQMHPQMQQMVNPQSLQQQQLLERMRKRQVTSPRPNMDMEKDRPLVQVKLENPSEMAVDGNAFNPMNPRHQHQIQQQFRQQQQIAALSNMQQQQQQPGYNQFRQLASMQIPQMQTPTTGTVRAQPVKVEGFEQLMGGDSSLKHETEDKLRSPPTK